MTISRSRGQRAPFSWVRPVGLVATALLAVAATGCGSDKVSTTPASAAAAPAPARCTSTASLAIRRNSLPAQICLRAGSVLTLSSDGIPQEPWEDIVSSNNDVLQCSSRRAAGGTVSGTCTASAVGISNVTTGTRIRGGSTNGPADNEWVLTVTIVA